MVVTDMVETKEEGLTSDISLVSREDVCGWGFWHQDGHAVKVRV